LLFWIGAIFFELFGISTSVWKIAIYLVSILGIWSTYRLGKLLYGRETGILSAIFWACGLSYLYYHNDIHTDTLLADLVIFSIWQLAVFFRAYWYSILKYKGINRQVATLTLTQLALMFSLLFSFYPNMVTYDAL
jgi:4-amino-4-deoxy-L-arabinose transferase-like glycosyltransferase